MTATITFLSRASTYGLFLFMDYAFTETMSTIAANGRIEFYQDGLYCISFVLMLETFCVCFCIIYTMCTTIRCTVAYITSLSLLSPHLTAISNKTKRRTSGSELHNCESCFYILWTNNVQVISDFVKKIKCRPARRIFIVYVSFLLLFWSSQVCSCRM